MLILGSEDCYEKPPHSFRQVPDFLEMPAGEPAADQPFHPNQKPRPPQRPGASDKHPDVVFGKVDTEDQRALAGGLGIQSIPTLMAFRGGYLVYREAGAMSGPQFEELVKAVKALDIEKLKEQANAQQEGAEA